MPARRATTPSVCSACAKPCSTSRSPPTAATACRSAGSPARPPPRSRSPFHDIEVDAAGDRRQGLRDLVDDPAGCDRFSARAIEGLDPTAPVAGLDDDSGCGSAASAPISLAVDVTNYVMLETGQPLHAFDRAKLTGPIGVRRARPGERLTTLDDQVRTLDPDDLVVTDDSGAIALAGVMGGASTEIGAQTSAVVLEAAHWDPGSIARTVAAAQAVERGVAPLRTRCRSRDRGGRSAALRRPARRVRRCATGRRVHGRRHSGTAPADHHECRATGCHSGPADRSRHGDRHARGGRVHRRGRRGAAGAAADVAPGPVAAGRPRRRGRAARRLREDSVGAAAADGRATASPRSRRCAAPCPVHSAAAG